MPPTNFSRDNSISPTNCTPGRLPFWTPYIWAGFPFLADPQLGAWYPLNWPFLAIGPSPRVFQAENLLHAWLACFGAYLLAKKLFRSRAGALFAGLAYSNTSVSNVT